MSSKKKKKKKGDFNYVNCSTQIDFLSQKKSRQNQGSTHTAGLKSKPLPQNAQLVDHYCLFNGITIFVGYLMPNPFFQKWYYLTHRWDDTFPKGICPKVNANGVRTDFRRFRSPVLYK